MPADTPPKVETPPPSDYDTMASVFDSLLTPTPATPSDDEGDEPTPIDEAAAAAKTTETPPETPPVETPPVEPSAATPAATPPEEAPPETPEEVDWKARYEALQAERAAAPAPVAETPPAPAAATPAAPAPEIYADDEKEFLADYEKQWPDVIRGEALRRRKEYGQLVEHIFSEVARVYGPMAERGVQAAEQVAENAALTIIQSAHNDYDDQMYDDVHAWVDSLTGTKQRIAKAIVNEGEPREVVELISEFKSSTGRVKPRVVAGAAPAVPATPVVTEISAAAKKAAKALGVVDSKRTAPSSNAPDPNDFDAAWDEAVGKK